VNGTAWLPLVATCCMRELLLLPGDSRALANRSKLLTKAGLGERGQDGCLRSDMPPAGKGCVQGLSKMARPTGVEPVTFGFGITWIIG